MAVIFFLFVYVPEDSNDQYIMDKQLDHYFPSWETRFDSTRAALRTSQGCLDLLNWYIDFDAKFEVELSRILGLRYRNKYLGDYAHHISDHRFEPFFKLGNNMRILLAITTHYYKGEDELGIGFYLGKDYLNFFEAFVMAEDFDRNFSLSRTDDGPDKITYRMHPIKLTTHLNKYWKTGHLAMKFDISNRYHLQSTEHEDIWPPYYTEKGRHRYFNTRFWQDINRLRLGGIFDVEQTEFFQRDHSQSFYDDNFEIIAEPMISYRLGDKWIPSLYLTYNYRTQDDSISAYSTGIDSVFDYNRNIYAYMIDVEFHPGGRFVWHFGVQQQFYFNNQDDDFVDERLLLGLEYRHKNVWFYLVEAMEGDFPTPKYLHNHTYVQLMLLF